MSEEGKEISDDIFDEPTNELVDLNSSQESNSEVQILDEVSVVDNNDNEIKELEEESIHRLRPVPSPTKRYMRDSRLNPEIHLDRTPAERFLSGLSIRVRDSHLNPEIHLDRNRIPIVKLDRNEIAEYFKSKKANEEADKRCQAQIDQEALQKAIDRQATLRVMKRVRKAEEKAKAAQRSPPQKKGKYPKNVRKIVKKSSLTRAEMSLAPPVASLHPEAPRTSTPKRIALEDLREGLRHCTQHCSSFYNRNGQPPLYEGTWPDHLSWKQAKKAYRRQVKTAESHPSLLEQLERPSVYDSGAEDEDEGVKADGEVVDEEEDLKIPTAEELCENIENPTPSTSKGVKAKTVKTVSMDKFESLTTYGQNLFVRGAEFDGAIEDTLEKLRRQTATKYALDMSIINAKTALLARRGVNEDIEKYEDRLVYLIGKRRRLLDVLVAQQEKAEEAISRGKKPTLAQLGLTIEAQEDFIDMVSETEDLVDEVQVVGPEPEILEPEPELNHSHVSSNLSEPGMCDPENPCQDDGPCRHMGGE